MRLAAGLHYRIVDEIPIFLDDRQGRYFLLRGEMARCFCAFARGAVSPTQIETLARHCLLERDESCREAEGEIIPPTASHLDRPLRRVSARLVGEAILRQWAASRSLNRRGFARVMEDLKAAHVRQKEQVHRATTTSEAAIAAAFRQAQRFISATDRCLPRSIAMAAMLASHGHAPIIVMGVQLPFAAHCWVQCEDRVVSDPLERIDTFEPILAL